MQKLSVFVLACCLAVVTIPEHTSAQNAALGVISPEIINGNTSHIDEARFMVQLILLLETPDDYESCGGSLITQWHVLSAGHCLFGQAANKMLVYAGASEFRKEGLQGKMYAVKTFGVHPNYKTVTDKTSQYAQFDVSVLRLKTRVPLGPKTAFIGIVRPGKPLPARVKVSGWGIYKPAKIYTSRKLRTATFSILSTEVCKKLVAKILTGQAITPQEFCIASKPTSSFCFGDSGGPAYIGKVQYGVVSWGACGTAGIPSVLANLADPSIHAFIEKMKKTL